MIPKFLLIFLLSSSALAVAEPWNGAPKPINGMYQVYGGELGDMVPPTKKDRKVSLSFTGAFAKELFDQIGPDMKDACGNSPTHRERQRGDIDCVRDGNKYLCYVGLNILTGKSMGGSIC